MDTKNPQIDTGDARKPVRMEQWRKSTVNNQTKAAPMQSEPIQREIKQIIPLDLKKLKDLGIESNILSALNKFNAKEKATPSSATKTASGGIASTSKQVNYFPVTKPAEPLHSPILPSTGPAQPIESHTPSGCTDSSVKKVQILSDIRLANSKLLFANEILRSAASLADDIGSNVIANTSQTSTESPASAADTNGDNVSNASSASDEIEEFYGFNASDYVMPDEGDAVQLHAAAGTDPSSVDSTDVPTSFGRDLAERLALSHPGWNGTIGEPVIISTADKERRESIETAQPPDVLECAGSATDPANASEMNESAGTEDESDLEDLIEQARLTMEHADRLGSTPIACSETESDSGSEASEMDNDSFIENFLQSTKNSFRIQSVDDSDDSDESGTHENGRETADGTIASPEVPIPLPAEVSDKLDETPTTSQTSNDAKNSDDPSPSLRQTLFHLQQTNDLFCAAQALTLDIESSEPQPIAEGIEPHSSQDVQEASAAPTPTVVEPTGVPNTVKRRRDRKMKQTSLIDLFSAPKNGSRETEANSEPSGSSKAVDAPATNSHRVSVIISPPKSSRYGRIIKPKSYDMDAEPSSKKRKVEHVPQPIGQSEPPQSIEMGDVEAGPATDQPNEIVPETTVPMEMPVRKRGRPKKIRAVVPVNMEHTDAEPAPNVPMADASEGAAQKPVASRGRRSGRAQAAIISPSTTPHEDTGPSDSDQPAAGSEPPAKGRAPKLARKKSTRNVTEIYTCGYCNEPVSAGKWKKHCAQHYGAAWRIGLDEAIDVNDNLAMTRVLNRFAKAAKMQFFKCNKCQERKRSALGYISHIEVCGLTPDQIVSMKCECPHCKKLYRKVSLDIHIQQFCAVRRLELAAQDSDALALLQPAPDAVDQLPEPVEYTATGRPKRMIKPTRPTRRNIDEFIKVGSKVTGGTTKNWSTALQADSVIKCVNVDCAFSATDVNQMRMHHRECRSKILQCRLCFAYFNGRDDIVRHIESEHSKELEIRVVDDGPESGDDDADYKGDGQSSSSDEDYTSHEEASDCDERRSRRRRKEPSSSKRNKAMTLTRVLEEDAPEFWETIRLLFERMAGTPVGFFQMAYAWTKQFVDTNYDQSALVLNDHLSTDDTGYKHIAQPEQHECIGMLDQRSMPFMCQPQAAYAIDAKLPAEPTWSQLDVFGSATMAAGESSILFCGGRISSMHWVPYPSTYEGSQTLIVCSQDKSAALTSATNHLPTPPSTRSLIQLWSISTDAAKIVSASFAYGVDYTDGHIVAMALCPSDAYVPTKRLAIAAIPDRTGGINILPLPDIDAKAPGNIVRLKARVRLQLGFGDDQEPAQTVTQLIWSRLKGHGIVCAGYNTGLVAIWRFEHLRSSYLCRRDAADNASVLLPYKVFQAALTSITHLDMHADNETCMRWLLVGSLERKMRMYDLNDTQLISFVSPVFKSRILAGAWPMHWPVYLAMVDAAWTRLGGGLHIKQILYTNNQPQSSSLYLDSHPSNMAFSDWLNTAIFGNDVGDVFMVNFHQMLAHDRCGVSSEMKILSSTDVHVSANESNEGSCAHIIFNDFAKLPTASRNQTRVLAPDRSLLSKINRIECNPNESHHRLYAIGYDVGFCRIKSVAQPKPS